jgi:low affinity Fe/Cu permease
MDAPLRGHVEDYAGPGDIMDTVRRALTQLGVFAAHPLAFVAVTTYGVLWFIFDRQSIGWHGLAVLATWCMTLLIQRAEHRDTQAIHAKLDELLQAQASARRELVHIDDEEPEEIERLRANAQMHLMPEQRRWLMAKRKKLHDFDKSGGAEPGRQHPVADEGQNSRAHHAMRKRRGGSAKTARFTERGAR